MVIMKFDSSPWIDRLRDDEALTDNLDDDQARRLLGWGERQLDAATSDADAERVLTTMRELNRRAGDGEEPARLLAELERPEPVEVRPATTEEQATAEASAPEPVAEAGGESEPQKKTPTEAPSSSTEINKRPSSTS